MDGLELLKKDWKKQEKNLPQYKREDISPMLQKKSTSVVKWIFIISIIEFVFWLGLDLLTIDADYADIVDQLGISLYMRIIIYVNYTGVVGFIIWFLRNYLKIKVTDNVRLLLKRILETRRSVKYYVWFNLIIFSISFAMGFFSAISNLDDNFDGKLYFYIGFFLVFLFIFVGLLWLIYHLIYGRLIKRLLRNYKEFKKED